MTEEPKDPPDEEDIIDDDTAPEDEETWDEFEAEDASSILRGLEALIPGILKRSVISGLANLSEESLRSVADKNIPKEAVGYVLSQADSTRRDLLRIVSREVRVFLENMDFGGELAKILTTLSFEIRTEVRFIPNDERVKPNIRHRVKVKRVRESGDEETLSDYEEEIGGDESSEAVETEKDREPRGRRRWSRKKRKANIPEDES